MKVLMPHVWRESELKSKSKMSSCEGILQFLLCHIADKEIKAFSLWTGLCFKSASQRLVNLLSWMFQKFLYSQTQSMIIFEVSNGFYLFILFQKASCFEGQSSLFKSLSSIGIYMHETKETLFCCSTTCNSKNIWIQQLFWALYTFHQIAVSRNTFPSDLQNSDICVIKIYSEFNMHISTDAIWEYITQRRTQNTYVKDD